MAYENTATARFLPPDARVEHFDDTLSFYASPRCAFGTDSLLLAAFALPKLFGRCADFGTGCGVIGLLAGRLQKVSVCHLIDICPEAIDLVTNTLQRFHPSGDFVPHLIDLRDVDQPSFPLAPGSLNCIVSNPPYFPLCSGRAANDPTRRTARTDEALTIDQLCVTASRLLGTGGRLFLCHRADQADTVLAAMRQANIYPKRICPVAKTSAHPPKLLLIEGQRGAKPGLVWLPTLFTTTDGKPSDRLRQIYAALSKPGSNPFE